MITLVFDVVCEPDSLLDFGVDRLLPLAAAATVKVEINVIFLRKMQLLY